MDHATPNIEPEQNVEITPATPEDARYIEEVRYKTWLATYPNTKLGITIDDIEDRFKDSFSEEKLTKGVERLKTPGTFTFVAKQDKRVIGMCVVSRSDDKNHLRAIYVLPDAHAKGVGNALWQKAKEKLDPTKDTYVEVADYNQKAIRFYEKQGFVDTGRRRTDERLKLKSGAMIPEVEMRRIADIPAAD